MSSSLVLPYVIVLFFIIALIEPVGAFNLMLRFYARVRQFVKRRDIEHQRFLKRIKREKQRRSKEPMGVWFYLQLPTRLILWWLICIGNKLNRRLDRKIEPYTKGIDHFLRLD